MSCLETILSNILLNNGMWKIGRLFLSEFESRFFFRIEDIMTVLMQDKTWPEFSEFAIISIQLGENKYESVLYSDKDRGSVGEVQ